MNFTAILYGAISLFLIIAFASLHLDNLFFLISGNGFTAAFIGIGAFVLALVISNKRINRDRPIWN